MAAYCGATRIVEGDEFRPVSAAQIMAHHAAVPQPAMQTKLPDLGVTKLQLLRASSPEISEVDRG